ncbi:hypothetical protein HMPREF9333_01411 [Johnsonella ignava ATCC 51276]|uniref:tRNA N6-adenosine threonylcarbamoyltransferase n=1 Tax=Johnsonella ignava ATCC 51276 TaxID=679200 RepID=G5GIM1_9FIRM|nr:tRNA (adenosine(37)-N6)-threonylcarbamoyltransferase complex transferase subunit TsaD [Johnsonella ignava]EHI55275.1 hypothetical protein HMPREF9333_01411 [Johnsonella ignava ATCC 51276]
MGSNSYINDKLKDDIGGEGCLTGSVKKEAGGNICILAVETSCDETAAAVVKNGKTVLSNVISSQIELHTVYGGVVPELASRNHIEKINYVIAQALSDADIKVSEIDAVAVTCGPGLVGALLVGVAHAKAFAYALKKPLIGVHHIEGHIAANYIEHDIKPPFLCLVVSGGHTQLAAVKDYTDIEIIGKTCDDAAGEAFDKVARSIGLGYPGGPKIDAEAKKGDPYAIVFPKAKVAKSEYDFSFSGVKSAVLNYLNSVNMRGKAVNTADVAASFQKSVVEVLVEHTVKAAHDYGFKQAAMAGGVAANSLLRETMKKTCDENGIKLYYPSPVYCTDNAAMIGAAAYYDFLNGKRSGLDLNAFPALKLGEKVE